MATPSTAPASAPPPVTAAAEPQKEQQPLIRLSPSLDINNGAGHLQRTATYAANPEKYLLETLGAEVFAARKHLLCLPPVLPPKPDTTAPPDQGPSYIDEDIYGTGAHKTHFETHIAKLLGREPGLVTFFITGIMAQNAALKVWTQRKARPRVAWHASAHLELAERKAFRELWDVGERILLGSDACALPSVQDVLDLLALPVDQRPAVILLEVPARVLGCVSWSWDELVSISAACRSADVALHLDGARLWDIEPWYQETAGKGLSDIAALFDSVYLSLYKGLRGTSGCFFAGPDTEFMAQMDIWRSRAGGCMFSALFNIVDNERAFNESIGTFAYKTQVARDIVAHVLTQTQNLKTDSGDSILSFTPDPLPLCPQFFAHIHGFSKAELDAAIERVATEHRIKVFGRGRSWGILTRTLRGEFEAGYGAPQIDVPDDERDFYTEFNVDASNVHVPTGVFVRGFVELGRALVLGRKEGGKGEGERTE